jgi:hypothetical protein
MASFVDHDAPFGFTDKRVGRGVTANPLATPLNYTGVAVLEARLAAINAGYYTAARLAQMTENDMVYATRLADDAAGVK